ncbi:dynein regulatory complex protein 10 [Cygnus olor]|uniref:dynein regulatory complex protein 10 n=1 Tax=Cygnus olor TaxID=8869 RepID=UPI001ADE1132|nr:dynein regulatory complex protein 10 [Cygnus olor]XP_040433011.1 dynein regulatory complex protein 10 [Cygnus olor]XP_040433012.1 dynein regulatory complex protein 10 [Cygnus olor]XP_040433013.1 dynein regulatory complex protein 10 [Cygnus olor]XP_040433014.1 dynein regulatory complex protein 10 [Cygnus olor]XP_040433015.1 dynein regulatory complex protein 10 [Cygnus olor]
MAIVNPAVLQASSRDTKERNQPPVMGIATPKKAVIALDAMKVLDPRWLKPDSIETERVVSVLDETIAKLELSSLIPRIIDSLDRFSALLGPEITNNLIEHQKLSSKMEHLLASAEEEDTMKAEEQRVSLCLLEQQLKCSVRNILRLLLASPSLCKALKYEAGPREPSAEVFIKAFREFRNFMCERLLTSPTEEEETVQFMEDVSLRIKKNTETITASQAKLVAAICTRDEEVQKKDDMIKDLKKSMQDLAEDCKTNILQVKWEGEKQQKEELRASRARCASLQQDVQQLGAQLNKLVLEHQASELALRKRKCRAETEILNWIQKYDTDMAEKQAEYEEVHAAYTKEKAQLSLLMEKHALLLQEYSQIEEERRICQEKKKAALEELATMTLAATRIQAFWRGYLIRSTFKLRKKRKGKGKGKGKDTKAKK